MNLLLLEAEEIDGTGRARLDGRRAGHLRQVLRVVPGQCLRGGIVGGRRATMVVESLAEDGSVVLSVTPEGDAEVPPRTPGVALILALPRPQVLKRVLQFAASMAVARLDLIAAWRVEKSFFQSPSAQPESMRRQLRLGAEQGMITRIPELALHHRFASFLDQLGQRPADLRLLGHPGGAPIECGFPLLDESARIQIAIGPEGGFIDREVASFEALGFRSAGLGPWILRVEAAVVAMLAQVALLRRRAPGQGAREVGASRC